MIKPNIKTAIMNNNTNNISHCFRQDVSLSTEVHKKMITCFRNYEIWKFIYFRVCIISSDFFFSFYLFLFIFCLYVYGMGRGRWFDIVHIACGVCVGVFGGGAGGGGGEGIFGIWRHMHFVCLPMKIYQIPFAYRTLRQACASVQSNQSISFSNLPLINLRKSECENGRLQSAN